MGMVVRSNVMAINAFRQLGMNNSQVSKSLEKLSSGFRINRAGDDASGLAISEKMKAQIRGLETASSNSQDGISLIQTAEGALTEVHDMLNRMVELAGKAANGTMDDTVDRAALQNEVNALIDEINRISEGTNFNGIKLLDGSLGGAAAADGVLAATAKAGAAVGAETTTVGELTFADDATDEAKKALNEALIADGLEFTLSGGTAGEDVAAPTLTGYTVKMYQADGKTAATKTADLGSIAIEDDKGNVVATMDVTIADADTNGKVKVSFAEATAAADAAPEFTAAADDTLTKLGLDKIDLGKAGDGVTGDVSVKYDAAATGKELTVTIGDKTFVAKDADIQKGEVTLTEDGGAGTITLNITDDGTKLKAATKETALGTYDVPEEAAGKGLTLQIGDTAASFNKMTVAIGDMSATGLGLDGISVTSQTTASAALGKLRGDLAEDGTVKGAINLVSETRARLGALQNRLEHTINNLDVAAENMTNANSRIRDTDMAKQMMEYTKMNVLTQAAQAMLAQANQQPQSVLQLLQ